MVSKNEGLDIDGGIFIPKQYSIDKEIGVGGMGKVYKGFTYRINNLVWVAIKVLDKRNLQDDKNDNLGRFHREAKLLARVKHPNIVAFHDYFENDDVAYLIMEYAEGITFDKWVEQFKNDVPLDSLMAIMLDVVSALVYMKESLGMHHRDIKPENIMVSENKGVIKATLVDFGNTKIPNEATGRNDLTTITDNWAGTAGYTPPSVSKGVFKEEDDVFSLACILMYGLLKHNPFQVGSVVACWQAIYAQQHDLGDWKGTFLGHWIDQNVDPDRVKRMSLKHAQRSLSRFRENPNFFGKCSSEKVKTYASDTALLSLYEQGGDGAVEYTPPPQCEPVVSCGAASNPVLASEPEIDPEAKKSLDAVDKSFATSLPSKPKKSMRRLVILLSLLALSVAGAGVAYYLGLIG